ncbi:hypothetical protein DMENIID0001_130010 [Sergentomyia squamirostris]
MLEHSLLLLFSPDGGKTWFTMLGIANTEPSCEECEDTDMGLPKVYVPVSQYDILRERLIMFLLQFNEMVRGTDMDLVFSPDDMLHLEKISRIIRHPRGNVMLSVKNSITEERINIILKYLTYEVWAFTSRSLYERHEHSCRSVGNSIHCSLEWKVSYEFNKIHFTAFVQFIQKYLDEIDPEKKGVSWQTLCYMLGEVQYGGRVTDDFDKRLLTTLTQMWFCQSLLSQQF